MLKGVISAEKETLYCYTGIGITIHLCKNAYIIMSIIIIINIIIIIIIIIITIVITIIISYSNNYQASC